MRLLVCGSRDYVDRDQVTAVLGGIADNYLTDNPRGSLIIVHGDAPGADRLADAACRQLQKEGFDVQAEPHPADWDRHGKGAGPIRNQEMADAGADLCIAFSDQPVTKGTSDMVKRAKGAGIPVWVIGHG